VAVDGDLGDKSEVTLSGGTLNAVSMTGREMTVEINGVPDRSCLRLSLAGWWTEAGVRSPVEASWYARPPR